MKIANRKTCSLIAALIIAVSVAGYALIHYFSDEAVTYLTERVSRMDIEESVLASGSLQAAELRLRESLAQTDAVRASFYPTLSLTGTMGTASTSLTEILKNPVASLGIGLALPFLQWNTTKLTIKVAETEYQEAVVTFRQKLYQALLDVENALSARVQLTEEKTHREKALSSALRAQKIAECRYRTGAVDLQTWLDAQDERRDAEITLAENRLSRLNNRMTLYLALGGDGKSKGSH